jgi:hypothetical protein
MNDPNKPNSNNKQGQVKLKVNSPKVTPVSPVISNELAADNQSGSSFLFKAAIALFFLAVGLYAYSISFQYALDDQIYITSNSFTKQGFAGIDDILTTESLVGFWGKKELLEGARYRPVVMVTYAIEYALFKGSPAFSHFINVLLYGLLGILLYRVLSRFFPPNADTAWYLSLPFIAAALYIAHPLHVEFVANIKGRMEILAMITLLATLWYAFKYIDTKKLLYAALTGFIFFIALLTKENAITFLAVVPLSLYFFSKAEAGDYVAVNAPLWIATLLYFGVRYAVLGFVISNGVKATELLNDPFLGASIADKFATIFYTMGLYIQLLFVPLTLTHDYYPKQIPIISWGDLRAIVPLILYVAMGIYALWGLMRKNTIAYGILFYLITFSIVSNLFFSIGSFMNDRFMDLPSVGFCIVLAYLLTQSLPKLLRSENSRSVAMGFGIVLLFFSLRTLARVPAWHDNETLFLTDVNISTNSTKVNTSAGGTLIEKAAKMPEGSPNRKELFERGMKYLEKALELYPDNPNALLLLGNAHHDYNRNFDAMFPYYLKLLEKDANNQQVHQNLSVMAESVEKPENVDKLIKFYEEKILPMGANNALDYDALGVMYGKKKNDLDKSIFYFEKAIQIDPKNIGSMQDMGIAYGMKGNLEKALELNQKVLLLDPNNGKAALNIAITYQNMGNKEKADLYFQKAFTLDPSLKNR